MSMVREPYYPGGVPRSINYPEIPLYYFLENSARKFPRRDAIIFYGRRLTYSKIWDETRRLAGAFRGLGISDGDRVGLLMPNIPQFIIGYYAAMLAGGVVVAVNPLNSNEEIERELSDTEVKILVVLDRFLDKIEMKVGITKVISYPEAYLPDRVRLFSRLRRGYFNVPDDALKFETLTKGMPLEEKAEIDPRRDPAVIQYTGGTTGVPKGVVLTHFSLVANALQASSWLRGWGFSAKPQPAGWPVVVCAIPFFHIYGMTVGMNEGVQFGSTLVLVPDPKPQAIMRAIDKYGATHFPAIPQMIREIVKHPEVGRFNLSSLISCVSGGASITNELAKKFMEITGAHLYRGYGLTEASPVTHCTTLEDNAASESDGLPFPDTEAKIVDLQRGEIEMPPIQEGELLVRGPQVMAGYWRDAEATAYALRGGWLHTGDVAFIDETGHLFVVDRSQDQIIASGHTVWPSQVEEVLKSHPSVETAAVLGMPDPLKCATEVKALVKIRDGLDGQRIREELLSHCLKQLKSHQVPSEIFFVESIPLTLQGKVDRRALKVRLEDREASSNPST